MGDILEFYFYAFIFFSIIIVVKSTFILWITNAFVKEKVPVNPKTVMGVSLLMMFIGGKR